MNKNKLIIDTNTKLSDVDYYKKVLKKAGAEKERLKEQAKRFNIENYKKYKFKNYKPTSLQILEQSDRQLYNRTGILLN